MTLAAKIAFQQNIMANAKKEIAALRAVEGTRRVVGHKRLISLLGKALLECFKSETFKHPRQIEKVVIGKMKPKDLEWYNANPHGLMPDDLPAVPQTAPPAASQSAPPKAVSGEQAPAGQSNASTLGKAMTGQTPAST